MNEMNIDELRYPIGRFNFEGEVKEDILKLFIQEIAETPSALKNALNGLNDLQLDTPYRPDGWTVRQVAHHLADSHMNSFIRFKLALTETNPQIKSYDEKEWAKLIDTFNTPIQVSVDLLDALHKRWVNLLNGMSAADFKRNYYHPERGLYSLDKTTGLYAWHGKHHVAHITSLRKRMGW